MSAMGVEIEHFDVPVCNSFQAKILNDQLRYEVDLNLLSQKYNIKRELKLGFNFLMDYNEDRQVTLDNGVNKTKRNKTLASSILETDQDQQAFIYLNTIGRNML